MVEAEIIVRRWGDSSLAIVIPKETVLKANIREGDKLRILIERKAYLNDIFGTLKTNTTGQAFKQMCKRSAE